MDYQDIKNYGVNLQFVEFKIAHIEQRVNERLLEYFNKKLPTVYGKINYVYVRDLAYRKIGGNQECLVCVCYDDYSRFYRLTYSPYENNKTGAVGMKFNKLEELNSLNQRDTIKEKYKNLNKLVRC